MTISLESIVAHAHAHKRHLTTRAARAAQRAREEAEMADYYASRRELRESVERALSTPEMDMMRFRWLAEHSERCSMLSGMSLSQMRQAIDHWQRDEAVARSGEMHNGALA